MRSVSRSGQTTGYDYDALGRKTLETEPDNGQVQTKYWPTGEVASLGGARTYPQSYSAVRSDKVSNNRFRQYSPIGTWF